MSRLPPDLLDQLVLSASRGSLLVPLCAKEVLVLRTIGIRWQHLVREVTIAQKELAGHPGAFGDIDIKMYMSRKYTENNVIGTQVHEIDLSPELFKWPL